MYLIPISPGMPWADCVTVRHLQGAGIIMDILLPSLFGLHCILGPAGVLPNMNLVESLADHGKIDIWSMVPSLVDELGETPDVLAKLKSSKFICASGGTHSPPVLVLVTIITFTLFSFRSGQPNQCWQSERRSQSSELDWYHRGSLHR